MRTLRSAIFCLFLLSACAMPKPTKPHAPQQKPAHSSSTPAAPITCDKPKGPPPREFFDFDLDQTGTIPLAEFLCPIERIFQALDSDRNGSLSPKEASTTPWLKKADRNRKAGISFAEFKQSATEAFHRGDRDKSAALSLEEFQQSFMWTLP